MNPTDPPHSGLVVGPRQRLSHWLTAEEPQLDVTTSTSTGQDDITEEPHAIPIWVPQQETTSEQLEITLGHNGIKTICERVTNVTKCSVFIIDGLLLWNSVFTTLHMLGYTQQHSVLSLSALLYSSDMSSSALTNRLDYKNKKCSYCRDSLSEEETLCAFEAVYEPTHPFGHIIKECPTFSQRPSPLCTVCGWE